MAKVLSIVIPAYNEAEVIPELIRRIQEVLEPYCKNVNISYEILFVNDGSTDATSEILREYSQKYRYVQYITLSRNFGHQAALKAGLDFCNADCVITMDADLQHPPELLPILLDKWNEGYEIVYTIRKEDKKLPLYKRLTSKYFYKIINFLSEIKLEEGTADFRLLDKKVLKVIQDSKEYHLFLRGYISWLGFKQHRIEYEPHQRFAGQSKYTFKKMLQLASKGIFSFSTKPLHLATLLGVIISLFSFFYALYAIYLVLFTDKALPGWASVLISILFIGGIQLIVLGILGSYIGKIFMQSKNRPIYVIKETFFNS
ncbi:MAG: glycosyltransferase family 2 protein [Candidatus Calescibacterium sp.]|nr:glycosyltransferase family 2 protein [Candidatus Calescibacterium sp.]